METQNKTLAVVIHVFFVDIFVEILEHLKNLQIDYMLYITTLNKNLKVVKTIAKQHNVPFYILSVENRGRDILPFFKILPAVKNNHHKYLLKLHTKKTVQRPAYGHLWRQDIFNNLLFSYNAKQILSHLEQQSEIGMVGPHGYILSVKDYSPLNDKRLLSLSKSMGVDEETCMQLSFIAGSMFYARVSALQPLFNLDISDNDFELESNQIEFTLGHVLERVFGICMQASSHKLVSTKEVSASLFYKCSFGHLYEHAYHFEMLCGNNQLSQNLPYEEILENLMKEINEKNLLINKIISSKSWYLTKPLRFINRTISKFVFFVYKLV